MLGRVQRLGKIATRVVLAIFIGLKEHCTGSDKGGISSDSKLTSRVWVSEDWLMKEAIFQGQEGGITCSGPRELDNLLCKINQGTGEMRVVWDEILVEVAKSEEWLGFFNHGWNGPILNSVKFSRVHSNASVLDNHAEVFNIFSITDTFLRFEEQLLSANHLQYQSNMLLMFHKHLGKDEDIVHVNHKPSLINLLLESAVHVCLEHGRGVAQTEEHDIGFK
jgi:hypothetical protein